MITLSGLGDCLKEARKAKGYSLDDLQAITKIQKRYLAGIENEDYSMMPGAFYVRAFIKQYAEAVGLDAQEMLSLYRENESSAQMKEEVQRSAPQMSQSGGYMKSSRMNEVLPKIIAALFIIVILAVVIFLYKHQANSQKPEEVESTNEITVDKNEKEKPKVDLNKEGTDSDEEAGQDAEKPDEPEEEPVEEPKPEQTLTQGTVEGANTTFALENTDTFNLSIKVKEGGESWIGVTDQSGQELLLTELV